MDALCQQARRGSKPVEPEKTELKTEQKDMAPIQLNDSLKKLTYKVLWDFQ